MLKRGDSKRALGLIILIIVVVAVILTFKWGTKLTSDVAESGVQSISDMNCISKVNLNLKSVCQDNEKITIVLENKGELDMISFLVEVKGQKGEDQLNLKKILKSGAINEFDGVLTKSVGTVSSVEVIPYAKMGNTTGLCQPSLVKSTSISKC